MQLYNQEIATANSDGVVPGKGSVYLLCTQKRLGRINKGQSGGKYQGHSNL
jgi:hypothetical protein